MPQDFQHGSLIDSPESITNKKTNHKTTRIYSQIDSAMKTLKS